MLLKYINIFTVKVTHQLALCAGFPPMMQVLYTSCDLSFYSANAGMPYNVADVYHTFTATTPVTLDILYLNVAAIARNTVSFIVYIQRTWASYYIHLTVSDSAARCRCAYPMT